MYTNTLSLQMTFKLKQRKSNPKGMTQSKRNPMLAKTNLTYNKI